MKSLQGAVVAITGAGSGIGRATAIEMAKQGAHLALADKDATGMAATASSCTALGAECTETELNVADRDAVYAWAESTQAHFGKVNVIVNNAGVALAAAIEDLEYDDFEWIMGINFWGVVYGTKAFLPYLKASGDGHIVNISSLFGLIAMPANGAYNATKFAVRGFNEALSMELSVAGAPVALTSVHPGGIDTNIASSSRVVPNQRWGLVSATESARMFKKVARTSPEAAGRQIVQAVLKGQKRLLIGNDAKALDKLQRMLPTGYQASVAKLMAKAAKLR